MANYIVAKQFGVVFMLILIHWGCCENTNCDVNYCKSLFSTVFKDFFKIGTQRLCRSSDDTIECANQCFQTFLPDFDFVNSNTSITSEICSYDFEYDLNQHWNCISGHFHRLLTCMSRFGSMTPTNISNKTLKLLSCKKFLEALNCPYEILRDCEEKAIEIVSKLFSKIFKGSMDLACYTISLDDAYDLPVTYNLSNSYFDASACLDKLPDVAGNCFTQYLKNFDVKEVYHCRNTCENHDTEKCLPSSLMKDFYIPVLSFGKHSCEENSAVEDKLRMQELSSKTSISHNSDIASDIYYVDRTENSVGKNDDLIPSDEAKKSDVISFDSNGVETSTLNYKQDSKEMDHDKVLSDGHSTNDFPPHTSVASEVHPEINSNSLNYATDNSAGNNGACRLEYYFQYLVASFITVFVFL